MLSKDQEQKVEAGSVAIQAGGNVTITGVSYDDVRKIALDVFRANFYELGGTAKEVARTRAEKITEEFLTKLQKEYPTGVEKSQDPDFQYALFTVQREYARNGDKDLGALLVDLLVDRCKQKQRDILQIVLNESLNTAPKLTEAQLAVLAVIFLFKYTTFLAAGNHGQLGVYFDKYVDPFTSKIVKNLATYQHLQFTGCGSIEMGAFSLEKILSIKYQGLFLKGFEPKEISERRISIGLDDRFFIQCLNDPLRVQVKALNKELLEESFDAHTIPVEDRPKISGLFNLGKMSEAEVKKICIEVRPYMASIFECWSESAMKNFTLTSVGIAIGHANIKRLVGEFENLSIWIN